MLRLKDSGKGWLRMLNVLKHKLMTSWFLVAIKGGLLCEQLSTVTHKTELSRNLALTPAVLCDVASMTHPPSN